MPLFKEEREPLINYDWIDVASATGYIVFDGLNALNSGGNDYILIDSNHKASIAGSTAEGVDPVIKTNATSGAALDLDFDLSPFQLPRTIEGEAIVKVSVAAGGAATTGTIIIAKLRKYSVATGEVEIASTTSDSFNSGLNEDHSRTLKLTVPKTHFKQGQQLRLTIMTSTTDADLYHLAHNPRDTAVGNFKAANSRLSVAVPFKLDFM